MSKIRRIVDQLRILTRIPDSARLEVRMVDPKRRSEQGILVGRFFGGVFSIFLYPKKYLYISISLISFCPSSMFYKQAMIRNVLTELASENKYLVRCSEIIQQKILRIRI